MAQTLQICFARHSLIHLGQRKWATLTWCGYLWAAWGSGSRFHPLGVQLSRHLQIFGLSAHWPSGSFWMGSHPYISGQVRGGSQGWTKWDIWWSLSVDDVVKDILHMTTEVAAKGYSGIKLCPHSHVDWSASTLIRAVAIHSRCTWQRAEPRQSSDSECGPAGLSNWSLNPHWLGSRHTSDFKDA